MPVMDGYDATKYIREHEQQTGHKRTPIIAVTANALPADREKCMATGMDDFLAKPVKKEPLEERLLHWMKPAPKETPLATPEPVPTIAKAAATETPKTPALSNQIKQVLLVEDNPVNQKVLQGILKKLSITPDIANNGQEGVDAFLSKTFDIVLMDCQMPIMNGYEATRLIRQHEQAKPNSRRTPIIAVTANALDSDKQKCFESGMDDFLSKPVKLAVLEETMNKWAMAHSQNPEPEPLPAITPATYQQYESINLKVFNELKATLGDGFPDLLNEFVKDAPLWLKAAWNAHRQNNDTQALLNAAQPLKSSSNDLGLTRLAKIASDLEEMGRSGDCKSAQDLCKLAAAEYQQVKTQLAKLA